jgi:uncharacterized membrane protein YgdD (TMEM256/DUF423 family)
MMSPLTKRSLVFGSLTLMLAVLIGAFGAHGLKSIVTEERLATFETGVRYQFYHGFGMLFLGLLQHLFPQLKTSVALYAFMVGVLLFSFNCYLYVLTGVKTFAMIVPMGGVLFIVGWFVILYRITASDVGK